MPTGKIVDAAWACRNAPPILRVPITIEIALAQRRWEYGRYRGSTAGTRPQGKGVDVKTLTLHTFAAAAVGAACLALSGHADAGTWHAGHALQGPVAVASPPDPPLVAMNRNDHALSVWAVTGAVRYAEKTAAGAWSPSKAVPGGGTSVGFIAAAIGNNEVAAIAYVTAATRYVPAKLKVSLRAPGGAFAPAVEAVPGAVAWDIRLGVACDGSVTMVWWDLSAVWATRLAGVPGAGACDGVPGPGPWRAATRLSTGLVGTSLADLATNDAGAALAVWQEGSGGQPRSILAALQPAGGGWQPAQAVSAGSGNQTWNPKPGLDAAGNAAVGYLDGNSMWVARKPVDAAWGVPVLVSASQSVYYPALAMSGTGDVLAAWQTLDANNTGSIWQSLAPAGGAWPAPQRLSAAMEDDFWPTAAYSSDGLLALVTWMDNGANTARSSIRTAGVWKRTAISVGWWGSTVPVAAGSATAVAGFAQTTAGNPNSATLLASIWR